MFFDDLQSGIQDFISEYGQKPDKISLRKDVAESILDEMKGSGQMVILKNGIPSSFDSVPLEIVESESNCLWELTGEVRGYWIKITRKDYKEEGFPIVNMVTMVCPGLTDWTAE